MKHKSTHGAISVFLAIILVPCIVITSIFVDLGRSYMSRSMAESAGDLALNTLMTNYDADLSEWYGMIASCQNVDEYYEVTARYFLRCMITAHSVNYNLHRTALLFCILLSPTATLQKSLHFCFFFLLHDTQAEKSGRS